MILFKILLKAIGIIGLALFAIGFVVIYYADKGLAMITGKSLMNL